MSQPMTYRCPHCGTLAEANPGESGEMYTCPSPACGKPFRVEVPTATPAAAAAAPATQDRRRQEEESRRRGEAARQPDRPDQVRVVHEERPVAVATGPEEAGERIPLRMFSRYPLRFTAYAVLAAVGLVALASGLWNGSTFFAVVGAALGGWAGYQLLSWWLRTRNTTLIVTTEKCVLEKGVLSREVTVVPREAIQEVFVEQGFLGRTFNVGDLHILYDTSEPAKLVLLGVPDPQEVAQRLRARPGVSIDAELREPAETN